MCKPRTIVITDFDVMITTDGIVSRDSKDTHTN